MKLLLIIVKVSLLGNSFCILYLWFLAFFGIRIQKPKKSKKQNRFAILVPVHNEEQVIDTLLLSFKQLDYPHNLYDCYFGADNCTDGAVQKILDKGFTCYEKSDGIQGKAKVLSWLTKKVLGEINKDYDAVVYFDADDSIHPNFLKIVNDSLNAGNEIIQGNAIVLNWSETVFSIINHINVSVTNRLKENARRNAGLSCFLRGHAMCFKVNVLEEFDWPTESLVEDEDTFVKLILKGRKVIWEHEAIVENRIFTTASSAEKQRIRWSRGRVGNVKQKSLIVFKNFIRNCNWTSLDALLVFLIPTYSVLIGASIIIWAASLLFLTNCPLVFWWATTLIVGWLSYFILGTILEKVPIRVLFYFLISPIFVFWRIWIYLLSFKKVKMQEWK